MTLQKAIDAAREALIKYKEREFNTYDSLACHEHNPRSFYMEMFNETPAVTALSTLPAKPMSEDEIAELITKCRKASNYSSTGTSLYIIRALRDAGCLYVAESGE